MVVTKSKAATKIREIVDPADPDIESAYALLKTTFHPAERVPLRDWLGTLKESSHHLHSDVAWHLLVATRNEKVVGLISGTYLGNVNVGVIGYLAITPEARSQGAGTRLRYMLRRRFERDAERLTGQPLDAIIGEVSDDNPWLRKLARRPTVLILDFPYYQPRLKAEDQPLRFHLYYESMDRPRRSLPASEVKQILYTVWRRIYRVARPLDRASFRAMLRALEGRRSIKGLKPE
jgi:ribosomal protein S18 acetylase RimI-like enzyme